MASSQIEIPSSSAFGYVLKDHNSRMEKRNSNQSLTAKSQSNFQRNLKELVRDHLHSCISISSRGSNCTIDENSNKSGASSCWGGARKGHQSPSTNAKQNSTNIWATTQTTEEMTTMVKTKQHNQDQEAEVIALSSISSSASSSMRETSPTQSDSDFSVSSLVQKWREAEARNSNVNNNNSTSNNAGIAQPQNSSPGLSSMLESNVSGEPSRGTLVASVLTSEPTAEQRQGNADESSLFGDCPYNKQEDGGDLLVVSDGEEREKIRVADIVRKWAQTSQAATSDEGSSHYQQPNLFRMGLTGLRIGMDQGGGEQRGMFACPVLCSPRIRGRQAITDLFMRMERERYKEVESLGSRQAVSKFPQRGRIQSLLKLRFLRREVSEQEQQPLLSRPVDKHDQRRPPLPRPDKQALFPKTVDKKAIPTITRTREKFSTTIDQGSTGTIIAKRDTTKTDKEENSTSIVNEPSVSALNSQRYFKIKSRMIKTIAHNCTMEATIGCNQESQLDCQEDLPSNRVQTTNTNDDVQVTVQEFQQQAHSHQEENNTEQQLHSSEEDPMQRKMVINAIEHLHEEISSKNIWRDNSYEEGVNFEMQDSATTSYNNWEEEEEEEEEEIITKEQAQYSKQFFEPNLDWTADIARPRSYWEGRRQAWYQEVFNTSSQNEEIRQLLERGRVSLVLSSDFRDRMDQLVMCSMRRVMQSTIIEEQEEDRSMRAFIEQCVPSSFDHNYIEDEQVVDEVVQQAKSDVEQEDMEEDEVQNEVGGNEEEDYMEKYYCQTRSLPTEFQWDHCQDLEANYDSDNALSTSMQRPSPVPFFDLSNHRGSPFKNSSIETELVYDLRAHMEQLYQEMSELRKSIAGCIEMQVKLQHSIKEEVSAVVNNLKKRENARDSSRRHPKKGNCCICYEKKVDSLLYRCGHICTCFNCAHELQLSSGNCPICRAQIIDVVRAYLND